jgi:hypothetical protein
MDKAPPCKAQFVLTNPVFSCQSSLVRMTKRFIFFLAMLPLCTAAQFSDSLTHFAHLSLTGNINRTNVASTYLLSNEAGFSIKKPRKVLNSSAAWVYGKQGSEISNNDFTTTLDFNLYNKRGNFYNWGLANYTTSLSLRINNQLQAGLGVAYNLVDNKTTWINLSDGLLYETSSIAPSDSVHDNYQTIRNSFRLAYRFILWKTVTINGSNFLQSSLDNANDYIIRSNNSVGIKLNKWLSFTAAFSYNQFRRTGAENLLFTYGLTAENYF